MGDKLDLHHVIKPVTPLSFAPFEDPSSSQLYLNRKSQLIYHMPASMPLYADPVGFAPIAAESGPGREIYQCQYAGATTSVSRPIC